MTIDLTTTNTTVEDSYELKVTEGYDLVLPVNEGTRLGICCSGVEDVDEICLECHLAIFA